MVTGAVICEFNPFHNGHKYLLDKMRQDGCDCIVCVISTSFTQRGDVAVYSKFQRCADALRGGADIIVELPVIWAVSSAQRFAAAGCDIIKALGNVDRVYFGSECGNIEILRKAAEATLDAKVAELSKEYMAQGEYYPNALQKAVEEIYDKDTADVLTSPNNTLGIEYIKSLMDSNIEIRTITRVGTDHDSTDTTEEYASASKIRSNIKRSEASSSFIPCTNKVCDNPAFFEQGERAVLYALRNMTAEDFEKLPDVSEGLHNRIYEAVCKHNNIDDILSEIKTKRYTLARLRRILTCAVLGITKNHQNSQVPYIRVLGFSSTGEVFLREARSTASLPFIINFAKDSKNLSGDAAVTADTETRATNLRTIFEKAPSPCNSDFTHRIIKV